VKRLLHAAGFDIFSAVSRKAKYPDLLNKFIGSEGMRPVREGYDFHDEVGILIEAIKL
jgi:hypothetical protein